MPFDLELAGSVRTATREALSSVSGVVSSAETAGSLVLRTVDQAALVAVIARAHALGLAIAGVVAVPRV
ncbi:hypothetical protein [Desertimonas flava]|uniref:hypothetical protein n=1 Tax=Desertimonas flava TaxID=2064846 RepID=UPI000E34DC89|nr:hypothetical protein [Desertimonas flava]